MSEKSNAKGKVLEFKPRKKRKLKTVDYVDPAQKELRGKREYQRKTSQTRNNVIRNAGYFLALCIFLYIIKITL